jgi:hypothetical protein
MLSVLTRSGMVSGTTSDKKIEGHKRDIKYYNFLYIRYFLQTEQCKTFEYLPNDMTHFVRVDSKHLVACSVVEP